MNNENWRWYIVVDDNGDCMEVFNTLNGAELWIIDHGGNIIFVKEVDEKSRLWP